MHVTEAMGHAALALTNSFFHINFSEKQFLEQVTHGALEFALSDLIVSPYADFDHVANINLEAKDASFIQSLVIPDLRNKLR
jgi:hypothetical protein